MKENWVAAKPHFDQSEPTETSTQPGMDDGFQALVTLSHHGGQLCCCFSLPTYLIPTNNPLALNYVLTIYYIHLLSTSSSNHLLSYLPTYLPTLNPNFSQDRLVR